MADNAEMDWQEKYVQFQMLQGHAEKIAEHLGQLQQQKAELEASQRALSDISSAPLRSEMLVPIVNGIFLKAELLENTKAIVNVGAETAVEHPLPVVISLLEGQQQQVGERIAEAEEVLQQVKVQMESIYQEIAGNQ